MLRPPLRKIAKPQNRRDIVEIPLRCKRRMVNFPFQLRLRLNGGGPRLT